MSDLHSGGKKGKKRRFISVKGLVCPRVSLPPPPSISQHCCTSAHPAKFISGEKAELSCSQSLVLMPKDCGDDHSHVHTCTQSHYLGTTVCCPP